MSKQSHEKELEKLIIKHNNLTYARNVYGETGKGKEFEQRAVEVKKRYRSILNSK